MKYILVKMLKSLVIIRKSLNHTIVFTYREQNKYFIINYLFISQEVGNISC